MHTKENIAYLIRPPAWSVDVWNPLFTYTLDNPTPSEFSILTDLMSWGWQVSSHSDDDAQYRDAREGVHKAIKQSRRMTQMVDGNLIGGGPRLTFEELWEREATKKVTQERHEVEEEEEVDDQASIMSQMTQITLKRRWLQWAGGEAGLEGGKPNVSQAVDKRSDLRLISNLGDSKNASEYVYQGPAGSSITRTNTNSASRFIEEDESTWHAIPSHYYSQHPNPLPRGQETSQSRASSTLTTSSKNTHHLLVDPYILAMATCGHWCPPPFLQAWSRQNLRSQSAAPRTELSSKHLKEPRKLRKQVARRNSEPGVSYWRPPRFVRPLSWVRGKRNERGNADLIAPAETQTEDLRHVQRSSGSVPQHSTIKSLGLSPSNTLSDSSSDTLQPIASTTSDPSLHSQQNTSTSLSQEFRGTSPAPSTSSSLIFPGREISQAEYFRRTNRPRENLQPRQLTPPPGLEAEKDPYEWQAWDRRRARSEIKTNRLLGIDSMRRSFPENAARESSTNNWYDDFRKKMKEEQAQAAKEQKQAEKEKKKEMKKLERQERRRKEDEVREVMRKQGMFAAGYLARYA